MNKRINNNLRAEIGYTDIVNYDDIEIKYNKKLKQFYFLRIEIQFMNVIYYDIITGEKIKLSSDWSHCPKHIVLPETTAYTTEELELLYNYLIKHKAEYIEKYENNKIINQVEIYPDMKYWEHELDLVYSYNEDKYRYLAIRKNNGKRIRKYLFQEACDISGDFEDLLIEEQLKEDTIDKENLFELRKTKENIEFYDAITGEIIKKEKLNDYEYKDKETIFGTASQYPVKILERSLKHLNTKNIYFK